MDSDWLSMCLSLISWKKSIESDSSDIVSLCRCYGVGTRLCYSFIFRTLSEWPAYIYRYRYSRCSWCEGSADRCAK